MKGSLLFILGAATGIIGYILANSPIDPFHNWIREEDCQGYYSKLLNIPEDELEPLLDQMKRPASTPASTPTTH